MMNLMFIVLSREFGGMPGWAWLTATLYVWWQHRRFNQSALIGTVLFMVFLGFPVWVLLAPALYPWWKHRRFNQSTLIVTVLFMVVLGFPVWALLAPALYPWWQYWRFKQSTFYDATGNGFLKTYFDKGLYGEYLIYQVLEKCPGYKHLLASVYLPKDDGGTTEVDAIMVHEAGIFVFESKNNSGSIIGDEQTQMWTQVLTERTQHQMFNPIWQNRGHIRALKKALGTLEIDDSLFRSYIVFGEGCNLQQVRVSSLDVRVLKRGELKKQLSRDLHQAQSMGALAPNTVDRVYELLSHYARADQAVKDAHIAHIKQKHGSRSS